MGLYENFGRELANAIRSHSTMPGFPEGLTLEEAYALLPEVASEICDVRARGIKAGLTNPDLQDFFGLDHALLGLLYDWGECRSGARLPFREHAQIECELGIVLDTQGRPKSLGPAIEFVHLDFSRPEDLNPANLVLSSLGADKYLCGHQTPWDKVDFRELAVVTIRLDRDGETLLEVSPYDSLDGPEKAVQWCIEEARNRRLPWTDNALLLTGTCGNSIPLSPGSYRADYGPLGHVEFTIDC